MISCVLRQNRQIRLLQIFMDQIRHFCDTDMTKFPPIMYQVICLRVNGWVEDEHNHFAHFILDSVVRLRQG